jgi:hypothetical protein
MQQRGYVRFAARRAAADRPEQEPRGLYFARGSADMPNCGENVAEWCGPGHTQATPQRRYGLGVKVYLIESPNYDVGNS